jgi:CubicO group peptidase (beta-lactamase class C family)
MSRVFGCALIAVLALALAAPAQADRSIERFLDATLPHGTSGTAVAVRDGRIVHCEGFGRGGSCDTVYDLMSMTKQFTAAAILKLEMQGRLRTSDPMERYVGPVPEDKRAITLHQLLTHTSGLTEGLGDDYDVLSREQLLAGALKSRLRSAPGREFHYSNVGYSILAVIVERVSGLGYEQFLAAHLLRPAWMTQTGYVLPAWRRRLVAVEYDERGRSRGRPFDHPWAADGPYWNLRGNGGLLSTARDMVRWHRALEGDAILSRRAKRKLFKPRVPIPAVEGYEGFRAAYGWAVSRTASGRMVTHSGGNGWSYGVVARFLDEGVMVFWISNRATRAGRWDLQALARKLTLGISART